MASRFLEVRFDIHHFAEGRFRRAYKGKYLGPPNKFGQTAVVKEHKDSYMWEATDWNTCVNMNKEAQKLAKQFNASTKTNYPIRFTDVDVIQVTETDVPNSTPKLNEYCVVEDYIPGQFNKWCNNYGFISSEAQSTHKSMPGFMHWSWAESGGERMISDLQGVRSNDPQGYTLTDPAMLSIDGKWGVTDTGVEGMAMFFLHHTECSVFCEDLPKPQLRDFTRVIPANKLSAAKQLLRDVGNATSYTHELKFPPEVREGVATVLRTVATRYY